MSRERRAQSSKPSSLPVSMVNTLISMGPSLLLFALVSILVGILLEWLGIALDWWSSDHALHMLRNELAYLTQFPDTAWGVSASEIALKSLEIFDYLGISTVPASVADAGNMISVALTSAVNILTLFVIRLAIVICAIPAFLIVALVALVDGLVERDIRRYCGGVESSFIYHWSKPWIMPAFLFSAAVYLSLPVSINPAFWFAPALALTGIAVYITASKFKKYA